MSGLSNLSIRSTLMVERTYQEYVQWLSLQERLDIKRRNELLEVPTSRKEKVEALLWGDPPHPVLKIYWMWCFQAELPTKVQALQAAPTEEAAFECLAIARNLYAQVQSVSQRHTAEALEVRIFEVLQRAEFRLTKELIEERLERILGQRIPGPFLEEKPVVPNPPKSPLIVPPPAPPPVLIVPPPAPPPVVAERTLTPVPPPPVISPYKPSTILKVTDPDLKRLVQRWESLPDHVKKCIVLLIDAAEATSADLPTD